MNVDLIDEVEMRVLLAELPHIKERLMRAGLLKSGQAMEVAVTAIGYEAAEFIEGKNLKPELFTPLSDTQNVYRVLGDEINVHSGDVYKVTTALGLTSGHVRDRMRGASVTQNIMSGETVSVTNSVTN